MLALLVLTTLAPSVSRAMAALQGQIAPWSVVCSTLSPGGTLPADEFKHLSEHCPLCTLSAPDLAPPPAPPLQPLAVQPLALQPPLWLAAPRPLHAWVAAQPRAPPLAG